MFACLTVFFNFIYNYYYFFKRLTRFKLQSGTSNRHSSIGKLDKNETICVSIKKCGNIQGRSNQVNPEMGLKYGSDIRFYILLFFLP